MWCSWERKVKFQEQKGPDTIFSHIKQMSYLQSLFYFFGGKFKSNRKELNTPGQVLSLPQLLKSHKVSPQLKFIVKLVVTKLSPRLLKLLIFCVTQHRSLS